MKSSLSLGWSEIPIPEDADAIYLGTSHSDMQYRAEDYGKGWNKITEYLEHTPFYISKKYAQRCAI